MTSKNETEYEELKRQGKIDEAKVKEIIINAWNKGEGNQPIKVAPTELSDRQFVSGYITQEKFVKGRTPQDMEKILGLEPGILGNGVTIYKLSETPKPEQFEPHGYSQMPGGVPYKPGSKYPIGKGAPQWKLTESVPAEVIGKVNYGQPWLGYSASGKQDDAGQTTNQTSNSDPKEFHYEHSAELKELEMKQKQDVMQQQIVRKLEHEEVALKEQKLNELKEQLQKLKPKGDKQPEELYSENNQNEDYYRGKGQ